MKVTIEIDDDDFRRVLGPLLGHYQTRLDNPSTVRLLSVAEVAYRLGVSRPKVYQLLAKGELDSVTIGGTRRISPAAVADFVDRRHRTPNKQSKT